MAKARPPGPTEIIARKDGTPTPTMAAFMREITTSQLGTADFLASLVTALKASGALVEDWEP